MSVRQSISHQLLTDVRQDVNTYLLEFFDAQINRAQSYDTEYAGLWRSLKTVAMAGGKRLRPYMTVLAYQSFGGKDNTSVLPVAAAQELLHVSMLIHDDIIDKDYTRHDKDNVSGIYMNKYQIHELATAETKHFANSAALIGGDLLISAAYRAIETAQLDVGQKMLARDLLGEAIFIVCGGEFLDVESSFKDMKDIDALKIAQLKTASYSFVSPLLMGAVLAGADQKMQQNIRGFGSALGIAFQLADDILGLYGQEEVTGKSASSDLRQGKRTYMLLKALELAGDEKKTLQQLVGKKDITESELAQARRIIETSGAKAATEELIDAYATTAEQKLDAFNLADDMKDQFINLIKLATRRSS